MLQSPANSHTSVFPASPVKEIYKVYHMENRLSSMAKYMAHVAHLAHTAHMTTLIYVYYWILNWLIQKSHFYLNFFKTLCSELRNSFLSTIGMLSVHHWYVICLSLVCFLSIIGMLYVYHWYVFYLLSVCFGYQLFRVFAIRVAS